MNSKEFQQEFELDEQDALAARQMLREADLDESTKVLCAKAITQRSFNTRNDPAYLTDLVERITGGNGALPDDELAYGMITGQMTGDALRALSELRKHLRGSHGAVIAGAYARLNAALDGQGAGGSDAGNAAGGAGGNDAGNAVSNTNADAVKNAVSGATNTANAASATGSVALNATNPAGTTGAAEPAGTTNSIEPAAPAALLNRPNASKAAPEDPARIQAKCDAQLQLALGIEKALAGGTLLAALKPGDPNSLLNESIDLFAPEEARAEGLGGEGEGKEPVPAAGPGEHGTPDSQGLPEGELPETAGLAAQNTTKTMAADRNVMEAAPGSSSGGGASTEQSLGAAILEAKAAGMPSLPDWQDIAASVPKIVETGALITQGQSMVSSAAQDETAKQKTAFAIATTKQDNIILNMEKIALSEAAKADSEGDRMGWLYLHDGIIKWKSKPAYFTQGKYDNGGQEPLWVDNDWLMRFERFREMKDTLLKPEYLFDQEGQASLAEKLNAAGKFTDKEETFDFINVDKWQNYRKNAFHGKTMFGDILFGEYIWPLSVVNNELMPDGLQSGVGKTTLYALASGKVLPLDDGKYEIVIDKVATFVHDGFDFDENQALGGWVYHEARQATGLNGVWMENKDFRSFRERTGYGCDFRIMSKPVIDAIDEYRYTHDYNSGGSAK